MNSLLQCVYSSLRTFRHDRRGNVAMIFALAIIPLIGAVGSAVDYSRANSARSAMQAALDSTALILSKDAQTLTSAQLNTKPWRSLRPIFIDRMRKTSPSRRF